MMSEKQATSGPMRNFGSNQETFSKVVYLNTKRVRGLWPSREIPSHVECLCSLDFLSSAGTEVWIELESAVMSSTALA